MAEAMLLLIRRFGARDFGAYLLSRAVPLPILVRSDATPADLPVTRQVYQHAYDARRYLLFECREGDTVTVLLQ